MADKRWESKAVAFAAACLILALGSRLGATASTNPQAPDPQTPVGLPSSNVHAGNDLVLWGASNDQWVTMLESEEKRFEGLVETHPGEGYEDALDRTRQDLEAVCALPETTAC